MATMIKVGDVLGYRPMLRSGGRLELASLMLSHPKYTPEYIQADFALYLGHVLKERVRDSIERQELGRVSFKQLYEPLSKPYNESKHPTARGKFWWNTRHLVDSLTVWRTGNVIRIGFKGNAYYPGTKVRVLQVVLWMERGTKKMPARPLFTPHARHISRHVSDYFNRYLRLRFGIEVD